MSKITIDNYRISICRALSVRSLNAVELVEAVSISDSYIWYLAKTAESEGLVTRQIVGDVGRRKKHYYSLTELGMAVANGAAFTPTCEGMEFSIKHYCNDVAYRQWLQDKKDIARGIKQ